MANCKHVLIVAAMLFAAPAFAGYAQMAPPVEWSVGNKFNVPKGLAVNDGAFWTRANISVGGRGVAVPARMRFAANSPRVAAGLLFRNPGARLLPGIGAWLTLAGVATWVWDEASKRWVDEGDASTVESDGYLYGVPNVYQIPYEHYTPRSACEAAALIRDQAVPVRAPHTCHAPAAGEVAGGWTLRGNTGAWSDQVAVGTKPGDCPAGWYVRWPDMACVQEPEFQPIGEGDFLDELETVPFPDSVPGELPGEYPVEMPEISPMWVPSGAPRPNPNADPNYDPEVNPDGAPYVQPGTQIEPANSPDAPWQVDVQPRDMPLPDEAPVLDPITGGPGGPGMPPVVAPQDTPGLCDQYPGILACQTVDTPESEELVEKPADFDFQIEEGFVDNASCPQPIEVTVGGQSLSFSWQPFCDSLSMIKSILLAMAWATAAFIMIGAYRN